MKSFFIRIRRIAPVLGLICWMHAPTHAHAQDTTKAAPELLSPSIELVSIQKADNSIDLKASMKTKFKGSFIRLPHLKVSFVAISESGEKELGHVITDLRGVALFNIKGDQLSMDKDGKVHLKASFAGNKSMDPADADVTIKRARLEITALKGDSTYNATVKIFDLSNGKETPVGDATVGLFVKRSFYPLKIGEGKTDSTDGSVSIEVPANLPGDSVGNITLIGRLDESEVYGNLEASTVQKIGVVVEAKNRELPRALWSTHPPTWMLITFIVLVTTVWGHYIVIIYELFRLRKEEPHVVENLNL
jgi:hypothetical protein